MLLVKAGRKKRTVFLVKLSMLIFTPLNAFFLNICNSQVLFQKQVWSIFYLLIINSFCILLLLIREFVSISFSKGISFRFTSVSSTLMNS